LSMKGIDADFTKEERTKQVFPHKKGGLRSDEEEEAP